MIGKILDIIANESLAGIHSNEKFFGIAETVNRQTGSVVESMPGIVAPNGEITYAGIDDVHSIMMYFKLNSTSISLIRNGVGDHYGGYRNVFNLSAYIYWDMHALNLNSDQVIMLIQSRMPIAMRGITDVKSVEIILTGANAGTLQIYNQEYASSNDDLKPLPENKRIVQLNFNIDITFNPECFRKCPECAEK